MSLINTIPTVIKTNDWNSAVEFSKKTRQALQQLAHLRLGYDSSPAFENITLNSLTASRLVQTDTNKQLTSVSDLTSWVSGTAKQVNVTDDGDGSITLSTPQDIDTDSYPVFINTNTALSPMIMTGGEISEGTNAGTVKVGALTAMLRTTDSETGTLTKVTLAEQDNITLAAANTFYHIILTYGDPCTIATSESSPTGTNVIGVGHCLKEADDTLHYATAGLRLNDGVRKLHHRASKLRNIEKSSGCAVASTGTRNFTISSGFFHRGINQYSFSEKDTSDTDTFDYFYYNPTTSAWVKDDNEGAHYTALDNTQYNNIEAGTGLENLTSNKYTTNWIFVHPDDEHIIVVYGQINSTLTDAKNDKIPANLPSIIDKMGCLLAKVIIQQGSDTLIVENVEYFTFERDITVDHNELAGLQGGTTDEYYHLTAAEHTLGAAIMALTPTDSNFIVGDGSTWVAESGATARTSLGLGTGDSPTFTGLTLSDLTEGSVLFVGAGGVISENNSELFWDATANNGHGGLGVGTTTPNAAFSVYNLHHKWGYIRLGQEDSTENENYWDFGVGDFADDDSNDFYIYTDGTAGDAFVIKGDSGNIGINVTDPDTRLEIFHNGNQLKLSFDDTDNCVFAVDTAGELTITPSGSATTLAGSLDVSSLSFSGNPSIISSANTIQIKPSGDTDDYLEFSTIGEVPFIKRIGGTSIILESDSTDWVSYELKEDISNYAGLVWSKTGGSVFPASEAALYATGPIDLMPNLGTNGYIQLTTVSNVPTIGTVGACDLKITSSSGTINFDNENLTTTGSITSDTLTITGPNQDFKFMAGSLDNDLFTIESQTSGVNCDLQILNKDKDGTDKIRFFLYDKGEAGATNYERLVISKTNTRANVLVQAGGTGTKRELYVNANGIEIDSDAALTLEAGTAGVRSTTIYGDDTSNSPNVYISSTGWLQHSTSSKKYKTNIQNITDSELIYQLRPVIFNSKCEGDDPNKLFYGLIAEEIQQVIPSAVHFNNKNEVSGYDSQMIMALMLKEIQNLKTQLLSLKV